MTKAKTNNANVRINEDTLVPSLTDRAKFIRISNDALNLLHQRIKDGTATSQELVRALSLASESERNEIEMETMRKQQILIDAKVDAIKSQQHTEELMAEAISAMKTYSGNSDDTDEEEE